MHISYSRKPLTKQVFILFGNEDLQVISHEIVICITRTGMWYFIHMYIYVYQLKCTYE